MGDENKYKNIENFEKKPEEEKYEIKEYIRFNNKDFSNITIKFKGCNMYLDLLYLKQKTEYFKSLELFNEKNKKNIIIEAKDIHDKELPIQKVLTWIYFPYLEIIKPYDKIMFLYYIYIFSYQSMMIFYIKFLN